MRGDDGHRLGSGILKHVACAGDGARGVNQVVDKHAVLACDVADHTVGDRLVRAGDVAGLVHEGERTAAEALRPLFGNTDTTGVRGDDSDVVKLVGETVTDIVDQHRHGDEMIDRAVKEALRLRRMQIDAHDAVGACGLEQVKHQTAGDGLAAAVLLILAGIAQQRADRGDGTGGSALQRIDHDELFHDGLVDRIGMALQHEHVRAAHGFGVAHVHFAVRKIVCCGFQNINAELFGDFRRQFRMCSACDKDKVLIRLSFKDCAHRVSKRLF